MGKWDEADGRYRNEIFVSEKQLPNSAKETLLFFVFFDKIL